MTDDPHDNDVQPCIHGGGKLWPPFPPPDWAAELAEAKAREREQLEAARRSPPDPSTPTA